MRKNKSTVKAIFVVVKGSLLTQVWNEYWIKSQPIRVNNFNPNAKLAGIIVIGITFAEIIKDKRKSMILNYIR